MWSAYSLQEAGLSNGSGTTGKVGQQKTVKNCFSILFSVNEADDHFDSSKSDNLQTATFPASLVTRAECSLGQIWLSKPVPIETNSDFAVILNTENQVKKVHQVNSYYAEYINARVQISSYCIFKSKAKIHCVMVLLYSYLLSRAKGSRVWRTSKSELQVQMMMSFYITKWWNEFERSLQYIILM